MPFKNNTSQQWTETSVCENVGECLWKVLWLILMVCFRLVNSVTLKLLYFLVKMELERQRLFECECPILIQLLLSKNFHDFLSSYSYLFILLIMLRFSNLIHRLAGLIQPDNDEEVPTLNMSYKPQRVLPKFDGTVKDLLMWKIRDAMIHPQVSSWKKLIE